MNRDAIDRIVRPHRNSCEQSCRAVWSLHKWPTETGEITTSAPIERTASPIE